MFDRLFPTWTNPTLLAAMVAGRFALNGGLTLLVSRATRPERRFAAVAAGLTLLSTLLTVAVLRGTLGVGASYLEAVLQVALVALSGYVARADRSRGRSAAAAALCLCALAGLLAFVPLYGEATVAP